MSCAYSTCKAPSRPDSKYCSRRCSNRNADDRREARGRPGRTRLSPEEREERRGERLKRKLRRERFGIQRLLENQPGRPKRLPPVAAAKALELYAEPGATDLSVAKIMGVSRNCIRAVRVAANVPKKTRIKTAPELAAARAVLIVAALGRGEGPFSTRDLERRFAGCTRTGSALVMKALEQLGVLVTWEPMTGPGGVRLLAGLPRQPVPIDGRL